MAKRSADPMEYDESVSKRLMLRCACGCGLWFNPKRKDQRFALPEHRTAFYKNTAHECPVCGVVHYGQSYKARLEGPAPVEDAPAKS